MNNNCRRFEQKKSEDQQDEPKWPGDTVFHMTLHSTGKCIEAEQGEDENEKNLIPTTSNERRVGKEQWDNVQPLGHFPGLKAS